MIPILVLAYNRPKSLKRLLYHLNRAEYPNHEVTLIISIDGGNNGEVVEVAEDHNWGKGEKRIIIHPSNLGLKNHVLLAVDEVCSKFGSVIVLEDDLAVSSVFYHFAKSALSFCKNKSDIGGVSLYKHQFNVNSKTKFEPYHDGYDNYYLQFASSWGQAWTKAQWLEFKFWLKNVHIIERIESLRMPTNVKSWSDKSWLKLYIAYLVDTNKYFLYPNVSVSSNYNDTGTHVIRSNNSYHVPMIEGFKRSYCFSDISESKAVYDSFFENTRIPIYLDLDVNEVCVNLHGVKPISKNHKYLVSSTKIPKKPINSWALSLKPIEANIFQEQSGQELFLYKLKSTDFPLSPGKVNSISRILYDLPPFSRSKTWTLVLFYIKEILK